jgi:hypothetical protein
MGPRDLEIHIDRIDLAAMPAGGERRLREALERALTRTAPHQGTARVERDVRRIVASAVAPRRARLHAETAPTRSRPSHHVD